HEELRRRKGLLAVGGAHPHQDDLVPRCQITDPMDDGDIADPPAGLSLGDDLRQQALRHAGIVLQAEGVHRGRARGLIPVEVPHQACEKHDGTDTASGPQAVVLGLDVEVGGLDLDARHGPQPPVTGGRKAISSPCCRLQSQSTSCWLTATITWGSASALARASLPAPSRSRSTATVAMAPS